MPRLHIHSPFKEILKSRLSSVFPEIEFSCGTSPNEISPEFRKSEIIITVSDFLKPDSFKDCENLQFVQSLGAGLDGIIDSPYVGENVVITSMRGVWAPQVSELALMHMLALARDLPGSIKNQITHTWNRWSGVLLQGKTVGILGVGAISQALAKKCKAFEMEVVGLSSSTRKADNFDEILPRAALLETVAKLDFFIILVPLDRETKGMIDQQVFSVMKPSAFLVNVARGGIVKEGAMLEALNEGRLAGAGLDVFQEEPLPADSPIWDHPKIIVTAHIGGMVDACIDQALPIIQNNIQAFIDKNHDTMINLIRP